MNPLSQAPALTAAGGRFFSLQRSQAAAPPPRSVRKGSRRRAEQKQGGVSVGPVVWLSVWIVQVCVSAGLSLRGGFLEVSPGRLDPGGSPSNPPSSGESDPDHIVALFHGSNLSRAAAAAGRKERVCESGVSDSDTPDSAQKSDRLKSSRVCFLVLHLMEMYECVLSKKV